MNTQVQVQEMDEILVLLHEEIEVINVDDTVSHLFGQLAN